MASQYSNYTKPELEKKLKKQRTILIVQGVLVFLMIIFAVFSTADRGMTFHTFLPLFFAPMFFAMYYEYNQIKKELRLRN